MNEEVNRDHVDGQVVMPFYILCDVSYSMEGSRIDALNNALRELFEKITGDVVANDLAQISVITFNHEGKVALPLSVVSEVNPPVLSASGGTWYGAAIEAYHNAFNDDKARLKASGCRVFRPCVFFLSDGEPGDDYKPSFEKFIVWNPETKTGNKAYPYIVSYGFGEAPTEHIKAMAYPNFGPKKGRWFVSQTDNVSTVFGSILESIAQTVVTSSQSAAAGDPQIVVPEAPSDSEMESGEAVDDFID